MFKNVSHAQNKMWQYCKVRLENPENQKSEIAANTSEGEVKVVLE